MHLRVNAIHVKAGSSMYTYSADWDRVHVTTGCSASYGLSSIETGIIGETSVMWQDVAPTMQGEN